jgi:hypothetical protein
MARQNVTFNSQTLSSHLIASDTLLTAEHQSSLHRGFCYLSLAVLITRSNPLVPLSSFYFLLVITLNSISTSDCEITRQTFPLFHKSVNGFGAALTWFMHPRVGFSFLLTLESLILFFTSLFSRVRHLKRDFMQNKIFL